MALFSATADPMENPGWCICRLCVDGFGIAVDVDGEDCRVCGEVCAVGRPLALGDVAPTAANATYVVLATATTSTSLRCSICRVEVEILLAKPCVSDDDTISSDN